MRTRLLPSGGWRLFLMAAVGAPTGCALALDAPVVSSLQVLPPSAVPAGCTVTLTFRAASQGELAQAKVTWDIRQTTPRRIVVDRWYAILPVGAAAAVSRSEGVVVLQVRPSREGLYTYHVEAQDVAGVRSNVLSRSIRVDPPSAGAPCPPSDPAMPSWSDALPGTDAPVGAGAPRARGAARRRRRKTRGRLWPVLLLGLMGGLAAMPAVAAPPLAQVSLEEAVRLAARDNPALRARQLEYKATQANEVTAALRPNPVLEYKAEQLGGRPFPATDAIPQYTVSFSQLIETGGKRQRRIDSARAATLVSGHELDGARREVVTQVQKSFTTLLLGENALGLARSNLTNLDELERLQAVRAEKGDISELELTRLRVQRYLFERDALDAAQTVRTAKIAVRALAGADMIAEDFTPVGALVFRDAVVRREDLYRRMLDYRPDLRAAEAAQARARAERDLARANAWWDFAPMLQYQRVGGDNTIGFGFSLPLRIFDRNQGEIARAAAEVSRADALREATLVQARTELEVALATLGTEGDKVRALRDTYLPRALQVRDTVEFAYRRGGLSLLDFLDAQRSYRETALEYLRALASHQSAAYDLEAAVGGPLGD
jgi:cobalt-zinc-cadmium efflux system outer membrane protein